MLTRAQIQCLALYDLTLTPAVLDAALRPLLPQYVEADLALRDVGVLRELFTAGLT